MSSTDADPPLSGVWSAREPWPEPTEKRTWQIGLDERRAAIEAAVPGWTDPKRFPPIGRLSGSIFRLARAVGPWAVFERRRSDGRVRLSRRLRLAAEDLGPTYIKLAQIISAGRGLFPEAIVDEFARCRDQVPAEDFATVSAIVAEELQFPIDEVFVEFDREPLAAASIAQVHRAVLRSPFAGAGEEVVVKVQRPTISAQVEADIGVLSWLAVRLVGRIPIASLANPPALVDLFAHTISEELDFRLEAQNMLDVSAVLAKLGQDSFIVPRPHPQLVTRRVLVMERLDGFAFDDADGIIGAGIDTHAVIRTGMIGFLEGALLHGVFHGDLHAGNIFITRSGETALLDFGITGRLDDLQRRAFLRLMLSATTANTKGQLAALRDLGALPLDVDLDEMIAELELDQPLADPLEMEQQEMIAEMRRIVSGLLAYGARIPKELMLFMKNMIFIDGAIASLAPDLDMLGEVAHVAAHFATAHGGTLADEIGFDADSYEVDLDGIKDGLGIDRSVTRFTYAELIERRELIRSRLSRD
ncbi:MAG: AarF/ABC1/UbiB kinase family protein [Acidobacteria bacterium]|nr:AarF/ABC1/UbiB kinase family protein [Acidobacteriota bacterium]